MQPSIKIYLFIKQLSTVAVSVIFYQVQFFMNSSEITQTQQTRWTYDNIFLWVIVLALWHSLHSAPLKLKPMNSTMLSYSPVLIHMRQRSNRWMEDFLRAIRVSGMRASACIRRA